MIEDKFVDLYARGSGLRDKLIAERDVVLTYALRSLIDTEAMRDVAFKGGTCLRKMVFGASGRFSEDLDFTLDSDRRKDDVLLGIVETFNVEHYGIRFTFDEYYMTDDDTSFGGDVLYRHAWNDAGRFRLQVSLRERPTLPVALRPLLYQAYFEYLEFEPFAVRTLEVIEMMAEKVRAVFQRVKARDVYDMYLFARMPFDGELWRRLAVLKLWQVREPFHPETFFQRLNHGDYDWEDLRRLVRVSEHVNPAEILETIGRRFQVLHHLTALEQEVIADARSGWNDPLAARLRGEIQARAAARM